MIQKWTFFAKELPDYTIQAAPRGGMTVMKTGGAVNATPQKMINEGNVEFHSPTGRTAWRIDANGQEVPASSNKQLPKYYSVAVGMSMTPHGAQQRFSDPDPSTPGDFVSPMEFTPRSNSWTGQERGTGLGRAHHRDTTDMSGLPQNVLINSIRDGLDVRTTIMLRNLPTHIGFREMKRILDITSKGKYDFSYLRIDFNTGRNVGYGFVNFTDPLHIVELGEYYVGFPWMANVGVNHKRGPRIAEISYATVQGFDCLVEKFRNSSILNEFRDVRPKLWHTFENAPDPSMVGEEQEFPPPNNGSKHQRSCDNAGQIGLYASGNRRNRFMSNDRHRRSQYDRGTTAQIHEEAYYNQMTPVHKGYARQDPIYALASSVMQMGPAPVFAPLPYGNVNGYDQCGNPVFNASPAFNANAYGAGPPFNDPFIGGYGVGPNTPTSRHNGQLVRRPKKVTTHPGRTPAQAIRERNEQKAAEAAKNAGGPVQSSNGESTTVPKALSYEVMVDEFGCVLRYNDDIGQYVNSGPYVTGSQYANGGQYVNGKQYANDGQYANGTPTTDTYGNVFFRQY